MVEKPVSMASFVRKTWEGLLDLVYPPRCLICEQYGEPAVCERCHGFFAPIPEPYCSLCGHPGTDDAHPACRVCAEADAAWGGWGFDAMRAGAVYEGALRHALHRLKYRGIEPLGSPLGAFLANRIIADGLFLPAELRTVQAVIPVPLRPSRERSRGFNQSALLAEPIAEQLGVPLRARAVQRATDKRTPAQMGLSGDKRRLNVRPAHFTVADTASVAGQTLLLVDDVFTTGSTVSACARALKNAGANRVLVAVLAGGD